MLKDALAPVPQEHFGLEVEKSLNIDGILTLHDGSVRTLITDNAIVLTSVELILLADERTNHQHPLLTQHTSLVLPASILQSSPRAYHSS